MKVLELEFHDNEKVVRKIRQHWVLLLWPAWKFLLLTAIGTFGLYFFRAYLEPLLTALLFATLLLLAFDFSLHDFLRWYLNVYVVTNQRIINITHVTLFRRQTTEAPLAKVQDVTHRTLGFMSMLFNYGDVIVQTAGHKTLIHFEMVPKPRAIHKEITRLAAHQNNQPYVAERPKFMSTEV